MFYAKELSVIKTIGMPKARGLFDEQIRLEKLISFISTDVLFLLFDNRIAQAAAYLL